MKTILTFLSLAAVVSLGSLAQSCTDSKGAGRPLPKNAEAVPVKTQQITADFSASAIVASGLITTEDETLLAFKTGGVINKIHVREGDAVKKGQLLASLDLTEINAVVSQARQGFEKAERDLNRVKNLYRDSVATLEQLQNTQTAFDVAKEQWKAATFNLAFSEIKAPADGFVLKKFLNPGQIVGPGDAVLKTNGAGRWILKASVSDKQWTGIQLNDKAAIMLDAYAGQQFNGQVIRKAESADPSTGSFIVEIAVDPGKIKIASGMFARASIRSSKSAQTWAVPYDAVLDADGNDAFVFVTNDGQHAEKRNVKIASFNNQQVLIESGLDNAGELIIAGSAYLTDGSAITIIK